MRRAIVATALSLLSSAGAFQLGPRLPVSRWVRPITTTDYLAAPSRPREAQCVVRRETTCLVLLSSTRVACVVLFAEIILGLSSILYTRKRTWFFSFTDRINVMGDCLCLMCCSELKR